MYVFLEQQIPVPLVTYTFVISVPVSTIYTAKCNHGKRKHKLHRLENTRRQNVLKFLEEVDLKEDLQRKLNRNLTFAFYFWL